MKREQTVLLVGGPDSGKTNYLGRLWLAIHDHVSQLEVDGTPNDLAYLNQIAGFYLKGHFAPHTSQDFRTKVVIPVKTVDGKNPLLTNLTVPDVSGEEWMGIYRKRGWSDEWEQTVSDIAGCLLFVRVDSSQNVPATDWLTWSKFFKKVPNNSPEIPTQVVLVDWLQCLNIVFAEKGFRIRPRIGVIVSAYDLLPNDQKSLGPDAYLKTNFPLFWQYIHTIGNLMDVRVFGISIADGDFKADPEFREKFLQSKPGEAGYVIYQTNSGVAESKDLTLPVVWAIGL
jgi:hypothetical protein